MKVKLTISINLQIYLTTLTHYTKEKNPKIWIILFMQKIHTKSFKKKKFHNLLYLLMQLLC